ncbi:MAG TPA: BrnA antitoxin family protein [Candidatus Saccharimonadales bacterium]|nr:BrnA antitoxin family protein [Candidatus Saccharimonadales bacterium]
MKKLTITERRKQLRALANIADDRIDTSDIPELTSAQMRKAVRGQWYRPLKKPVTMRLDVDVIEWLKKDGSGYQTKANRLLRTEMLRSYGKKPVQSEPRRAGKQHVKVTHQRQRAR